MEKEPTIRVTVRIPGDLYRNAEVALRRPENAHLQTMSDFVKRGYELALIEACRNIPDPSWSEAAETLIELRQLEAARKRREWKEKLRQEQWLAECISPTDNRRREEETRQPPEPPS